MCVLLLYSVSLRMRTSPLYVVPDRCLGRPGIEGFRIGYSSQIMDLFCGIANTQSDGQSPEEVEKCLRDFHEKAQRQVRICDGALKIVLSESFKQKLTAMNESP